MIFVPPFAAQRELLFISAFARENPTEKERSVFMKKFLSITVAALLCLSAAFAVACGNNEDADTGDGGKQDAEITGTVYAKYGESASDILPLMKTGKLHYALLPEPAATKLNSLAPDTTFYRLDLQELYDADTKAYPQAVMMIRSSLLNAYKDLAANIANSFADNVSWIKENPADAVAAVNGKLEEGVTPSLAAGVITAEVVDNCKIFWQSAADAKDSVNKYLEDIIAIDAKASVKPQDDFFYNGTAEGDKTYDKITVYAPDGAPALSIAKFINDNYDLGTGLTVEYHVVSSGNIGPVLAGGKGDIVVMPVNAAAKLYLANYAANSALGAEGNKYMMAGVVTHGNLYIVSDQKISVEDLKDKTVGVIGMGLVPDLTFKAVLAKYGLELSVAD